MLMRIIVCALLAGGIAGGVSALLQQALVVPLIMQAEVYETAGGGNDHGADHDRAVSDHAAAIAHDHGTAAHEHDAGGAGWLARPLTTAVMTVGVNVGFAFLLLAAFHARDARPGLREGLVWGVAGFAALMLAPAAGLPPELPGSAAGPLEARQLWWVATAASAAGALWLVAFMRLPWAWAVAVLLLVAPHLVGAPEADGVGVVPPDLAADFAARALAVGFVSWAVLGAAAAWAWDRQLRAAHAVA